MKRLSISFSVFCLILILNSCSRPKPVWQVSVTFGKAWAYSPHSNEILDWSGNLKIENGTLDSLFKLTYGITDWAKGYGGCSREYSRKLDAPVWQTDIRPGSGRGLEGLRFFIRGDEHTRVSIQTNACLVSFELGELIDKEYLEFPVGGYYSFQPVSVYLGPDARPRTTKKMFSKKLAKENRSGLMLIPDDFSGSGTNFMSAWCTAVPPLKSISSEFQWDGSGPGTAKTIPLKLQLMAGSPQEGLPGFETASGWMDFEVTLGSFSEKLRHYFTFFRQAEKLYDIYVDVPVMEFNKKKSRIQITNLDKKLTLLLHRAYINESPPSHLENVSKLPPLPADPVFWVGYDLNTSTTQDGEVDSLIDRMKREEMGNYLLFRIEESNSATAVDFDRWGAKIRDFGFKAGTTMGGEVAAQLSKTIGKGFIGIHQHESSNLIYGWGDSEPLAARINRTLPDCEAAYMNRMKKIRMLGQALPMCNLDYKSGVDFISSEFPTGHSTLMMAANRGGSYLYDKPFWGVHLANHVMRMPDDESTLRRNFLFLWQSWLYGARLIYDEESAVYGIHSTSYSYSDPMSFIRRQQMQELYHYGSSTVLGKEVVKTGYLLGKYDCLVGGVQSSPEMEPTKVWGMFGPETESWKFDTPERGWELLNIFMPGVWLYPVSQDNSKIRMFFSASPNGQTDLVTIDGEIGKLNKYELLILPGWNTMTAENYNKLIAYVQNGGHLVIAATQMTNHITRDFLRARQDFDFFNGGDFTGLSGIRVGGISSIVKTIRWNNRKGCSAPGLPGLTTELAKGALVLAESDAGSPVLVENRIGKGRVWTLVAAEFWGAAALDDFRVQLGDTLTAMHRGDLFLTGDSGEIDYHVYELPGGIERIALLNTDWTRAGNSRNVVIHHSGSSFPVSVKEGELTNVLIDKEFSICSSVPGTGARILNRDEKQITLSLSGTGRRIFVLNSDKSLKLRNSNDNAIVFNGSKLTMDFENQWQERILIFDFLTSQ